MYSAAAGTPSLKPFPPPPGGLGSSSSSARRRPRPTSAGPRRWWRWCCSTTPQCLAMGANATVRILMALPGSVKSLLPQWRSNNHPTAVGLQLSLLFKSCRRQLQHPTTQAQLEAWDKERRRQAYLVIATYWGGMLFLNILFALDPRFRELVEGCLDVFYSSGVMAMAFYAVVALSNPGYLPLASSTRNDDKDSDEEDHVHSIMEEGRRSPTTVSAAGELGPIREGSERSSRSSGEYEDGDDKEEAELCAYLRVHQDEELKAVAAASAAAASEESDSLLLEVVEATTTVAADGAASQGMDVRDWLRHKYCASCRVHRLPLRTNHCDSCGRCVSRMDHHCAWVNNCIGAGNHLAFVLFLMFQWVHLTLALILLLVLGVPTLLSHYNFSSVGSLGVLGGLVQILVLAAPQAICERPYQSCLFLLVSVVWVMVHNALLNQLRVVTRNLLTIEAKEMLQPLNSSTNPFDKGCCLNVLSFLSLFYQYHQERRIKERREKQRQAHNEQPIPLLSSNTFSSSGSSSSPSSSSSSSTPSSSHSSPLISPTHSPTAPLTSGIAGFSSSSSSSASSSSSLLSFFKRKFPSSSFATENHHSSATGSSSFSLFRSKKGRATAPLKIAP